MIEDFDLKELNNFIHLLKSAKDDISIESYIYIKNLLNRIEFDLPCTIYSKGTIFIRTRVHTESQILFKKVNELSYIEDIQKITKFGRANEPGQSIFYCSDIELVSLAETNQIAREQKDKEFEYSTTGYWISTEDIVAVSLLTNENLRGKHSEIDIMSTDFEDLVKAQNDENAQVVSELLQFLSKEFSTLYEGNSNNYKITTAFANYIYETVNNADGILYPSTMYPNEGFNFAFKPEVIEKKMQFVYAHRTKLEKCGDKKYELTEQIFSKVNKEKRDVIEWE